MKPTITPSLWFDGNAEEAAAFYVTLFDDSRVTALRRYPKGAPGPEGQVMTVEFELGGMPFVGINGGPQFPFTEAVSFQIACQDQDEVDRFWTALTADGGQEGPCGWCKDRFGLSWQVVPRGMDVAFDDADPAKAERSMGAMLGMKKIDVGELRRAAEGEPAT